MRYDDIVYFEMYGFHFLRSQFSVNLSFSLFPFFLYQWKQFDFNEWICSFWIKVFFSVHFLRFDNGLWALTEKFHGDFAFKSF